MRVVAVALATIALLALAGLGFIYSGIYNIAATAEHSPPLEWALHTAMHRSVERHADAVEVPPNLDAPDLIARGAAHYEAYCALCHLSPIQPESAFRDGLTPQPPALAETHHWGAAELYWITRHGIKFTGMPAWEGTLSDTELWEVVALMQALPELSAEDYQALMLSE